MNILIKNKYNQFPLNHNYDISLYSLNRKATLHVINKKGECYNWPNYAVQPIGA